jgi:hypothetical protein
VCFVIVWANKIAHLLPSLEKQMAVGWGGGREGGSESSTGQGAEVGRGGQRKREINRQRTQGAGKRSKGSWEFPSAASMHDHKQQHRWQAWSWLQCFPEGYDTELSPSAVHSALYPSTTSRSLIQSILGCCSSLVNVTRSKVPFHYCLSCLTAIMCSCSW